MQELIQPIKILDVPVHPLTMAQAADFIRERAAAGQQTFVVTANAEIIMMCQQDAAYKAIICRDAELVLPDGAGAVWAGRHLGYKVPERVAGFDLFNRLMEESVACGHSCYFFGGAPGVAEAAKAKSEALYPGVKICGTHSGYFSAEEEDAIIGGINASGADYLFVALGAPKQELWLQKHRSRLKPRLLMGIGGSFDVLAGKMERAPKWMQDASLEWLFRLYKQPRRFIRMLALPRFALKVIFSGK